MKLKIVQELLKRTFSSYVYVYVTFINVFIDIVSCFQMLPMLKLLLSSSLLLLYVVVVDVT